MEERPRHQGRKSARIVSAMAIAQSLVYMIEAKTPGKREKCIDGRLLNLDLGRADCWNNCTIK